MEHNALNQQARFERYAASLLCAIAAGVKIDPDRTEKFTKQMDDLYKNPFTETKQQNRPTSAADIRAHILSRIREMRDA